MSNYGTLTPNLGLLKPRQDDFCDIDVINVNMDILDETLARTIHYNRLGQLNANFTESTPLTQIFDAMTVPSRLTCNISAGAIAVYPAAKGTLMINKTSSDTGNAVFIDDNGRVANAVFTVNSNGGGGNL